MKLIKTYNGLNDNYNKYKNIDNDIYITRNDVYKLSEKLENSIIKNKTKYKIAYLTFDDGPYYNTYKVLDILKKTK